MNAKTLTLAALSLSLMASCGAPNKNGVETTGDTVAQEVDAQSADAKPIAYNSADLKKFGLVGQVKTVTLKEYEGKDVGPAPFSEMFGSDGRLTFSEDGTMEINDSPNTTDRISIETNELGFADVFSAYEWWGDLNYKFELNEQGWPISGVFTYVGPEEAAPKHYSYSYPEVDSYGNWTKCVIEQNGVKGVQNRTIEYY